MVREKANGGKGREIGGGPPPPTDDPSYDHRVKQPKGKDKAKSAALDMTASPGVDDLDKKE